MATRIVASTILVYACTLFARFLARLYHHRSQINTLRKQGLPMPAWSWILGHIIFLYRQTRVLPPHANLNLMFRTIASDFADEEMFLLDLWPMAAPLLVVFNPEAAIHVCQKLDLPKAEMNEAMIRSITGGLTLLSMTGNEWKTWRAVFNPGFSSSTMAQHVPRIVDSTTRFCDQLHKVAGKEMILLDELITRLTFEVILGVSLNEDLGLEYPEYVFVRAMSKILSWHSFWDLSILLNPIRPIIQWYYGRVVDGWVREKIEESYKEYKQDHAHFIFNHQGKNTEAPQRLDRNFLESTTHHIRLFLLVGNDTTSSTIAFVYYLLYKSPSVLALIQQEHDKIFGNDPSKAAIQLKNDSSLLGKYTYTLAVIKETLRLYPPAATLRKGTPGTWLQTRRGTPVSIEDISVLISHHALHRNDRIWPHADDFAPERWLTEPNDDLHPKSGSWRAFELGPRNCIGQLYL